LEEMHRFLGMLLRISLQPVDSRGYCAYFRETNLTVPLSQDKSHYVGIPETRGFVALLDTEFRMSLNRFKQIRGAFHPDDKTLANSSEDKCYQLRAAINELNAASMANYVPESNYAFDEGGIVPLAVLPRSAI
jgi:Transposase IS4